MDVTKMHKELDELFPEIIAIRRDLHAHPELGYEEVRTPRIIAEYLRKIGIEVRTGVGGFGVVGTLRGGKKGKTVAFRADFDALPIQDEKDVPYKSTIPGKMHACGHDGHTAALLGAATVLAKHREQIKGNVVFIHQFAEEVHPGGAKPMIEDGCLDGVDIIFGAHILSRLPFGDVYFREGYLLGSADDFDIKIHGRGGHGAAPHMGVDPVVTGSQLVVNLQQIVSRNINPTQSGVLTIGSFQAGDTSNVIPEIAHLKGTVRAFDPEVRNLMEERLEQITKSTCEASGATYELAYSRGYDSLWNHPEETRFLRSVAEKVVGKENVKEAIPTMGGEDFSYFTQKIPGTYFTVGGHIEGKEVYPNHHPKFDFDERVMLIIAKIFILAIADM